MPSLQSRARSEGRTPPLPPRKPTNPVIPPPRHAAALAPPAHPNLLIQQSLQATRVAQSLKKAEQRLEQERVLEVLKSSSAHGGRRTRSNSPSRAYDPRDGAASESAGSGDSLSLESAGAGGARTPSLPPRRKISPPASTLSGSTSRSLEQVARASVPFRPAPAPASAFKPALPPALALAELPADPPPTHPDRKPSLDAERPPPDTPRMFRSKSMHHASPPPPAPPARKRRPESVQLGPAAGGDASPFVSPSPSMAYFLSPLSHQGPGSLSRHHSLSSSGSVGARTGSFHSDGAAAPLADLRRTLSNLHQRAAPRLDSARYKAEAAFTPRGFVQHAQPGTRWMREDGEESLIEGDDDSGLGHDDAAGVDRDGDGDVEEYSQDESELSQRLRKIRMREGAEDGPEKAAAARRVGVERDELKWPVGDGWERL